MPAARLQSLRRERNRDPKSNLAIQKLKTGGHHANNAVFFAVQQDVAADDISIPCITLLPQSVTEYCHPVRAGLIVICRKPLTNRRLDTEQREEIRSRAEYFNFLRFSVASQI